MQPCDDVCLQSELDEFLRCVQELVDGIFSPESLQEFIRLHTARRPSRQTRQTLYYQKFWRDTDVIYWAAGNHPGHEHHFWMVATSRYQDFNRHLEPIGAMLMPVNTFDNFMEHIRIVHRPPAPPSNWDWMAGLMTP